MLLKTLKSTSLLINAQNFIKSETIQMRFKNQHVSIRMKDNKVLLMVVKGGISWTW
jgi:hypothetical protein